MKRILLCLALCTALLGATVVGAPARAAGPLGTTVLPVPGPVVHGYDPPAHDWEPGHRGVDLSGLPGDTVRAAAGGTVTFAGQVAGVPVVTVSHGALRTTYEPVRASVAVGTAVAPGDAIGVLEGGHPGCPTFACLHWGLKEGDRYLDPLSLVAGAKVRLVASATPVAAPAVIGPGSGPLRRPPGPVTSEFGMRVHPVTGDYVLHDGTDFGLACGVPMTAAGDGVVTRASEYGGYGLTIEIDHGMIDGHHVTTLYGHASAIGVQVGAAVKAGDTIGLIGTTGWSTGCHLHFGVYVDGVPADPLLHTS